KAVQRDGDKQIVWVQRNDKEMERREVTTGAEQNGQERPDGVIGPIVAYPPHAHSEPVGKSPSHDQVRPNGGQIGDAPKDEPCPEAFKDRDQRIGCTASPAKLVARRPSRGQREGAFEAGILA
ncbi:MAG: hypothetical protein ABSA33_06285, partial [Candidatus Micrarchaeaceae archaeon]